MSLPSKVLAGEDQQLIHTVKILSDNYVHVMNHALQTHSEWPIERPWLSVPSWVYMVNGIYKLTVS